MALNHSISSRLERVRDRLRDCADSAGRTDDVMLIAVSKTVEPDRIWEAYAAGQRLFGENRVQEAVAKRSEIGNAMPESQWHLVGTLQTNKVNPAVACFAWIQSVDSLKLARKLQAACAIQETTLSVLLEVNVAAEASKSGLRPDTVTDVLREITGFHCLRPRGLMTVAPLADNPEDVRWVFRTLREMRDGLRERFGLEAFTELSMGMSNDFEVAVKEGATMVRIGRGIFGERPVMLR